MLKRSDILVLQLLSKKPLYGYQFRHLSVQLRTSTTYNTLNRLQQMGYCTNRIVLSSVGPQRKLYRITPLGTRKLEMALTTRITYIRKRIEELLKKYVRLKKELNEV